MTKRALVLGGGGVAGISWETGVIVGMADAGLDVRNADLFLGTSAGSTVAAQITSGLTLDELFLRQVNPALQAAELPAQVDFQQMGADYMNALEGARNASEILQRVGVLALAAPTVTEAEQRAVIVSRLPVHSWPQSRLAVVAVDVHSGERRVFERDSGVNLVDAVAASCAVPLIWPPVAIDGHRYMDGGAYSNENADLASGFDRVLVITPEVPFVLVEKLDTQVERLQQNGARVEIVHPDEAMNAALASVGGNVLDPSLRGRAAEIGREQGRRIADQMASLWR
jgi:NTE family protein